MSKKMKAINGLKSSETSAQPKADLPRLAANNATAIVSANQKNSSANIVSPRLFTLLGKDFLQGSQGVQQRLIGN